MHRGITAGLVALTAFIAAGCAGSTLSGSGRIPQPSDIVLQQGDLPGQWSQEPSDTNDDPAADDADRQVARCLAGSRVGHAIAQADSPDFDQQTRFVGSSATLMSSVAGVRADIARLLAPKTGPCLASAFESGLGASLGKDGTVSHYAFRLVPRTAEQPKRLVVMARAAFDLTKTGRTLRFHFDIAFLAGERSEAAITFVSVDPPFTDEFEMARVQSLADRMS